MQWRTCGGSRTPACRARWHNARVQGVGRGVGGHGDQGPGDRVVADHAGRCDRRAAPRSRARRRVLVRALDPGRPERARGGAYHLRRMRGGLRARGPVTGLRHRRQVLPAPRVLSVPPVRRYPCGRGAPARLAGMAVSPTRVSTPDVPGRPALPAGLRGLVESPIQARRAVERYRGVGGLCGRCSDAAQGCTCPGWRVAGWAARWVG